LGGLLYFVDPLGWFPKDGGAEVARDGSDGGESARGGGGSRGASEDADEDADSNDASGAPGGSEGAGDPGESSTRSAAGETVTAAAAAVPTTAASLALLPPEANVLLRVDAKKLAAAAKIIESSISSVSDGEPAPGGGAEGGSADMVTFMLAQAGVDLSTLILAASIPDLETAMKFQPQPHLVGGPPPLPPEGLP